MEKILSLAAIFALAAFLLLAGCTAPPSHSPIGNGIIGNGTDSAGGSATAAQLASAHNSLGFALLHGLVQNGSNVFISPTSISLALSMAYAGSGGQTQSAMAGALGLSGFSKASVNLGSRYLIDALSTQHSVQLSIADSIWLNNGTQLLPSYQQGMQDYYDARAATLDFSSPSSADVINGWVSSNTNGKIPSIVSPQQLAGSEAVLVNAVYFKGEWSKPFDMGLTSAAAFTGPGGTVQTAQMMQQTGEYRYLENSDFQAVRLPYGNGSESMYVFLPKEGTAQSAAGFASGINSSDWAEWQSQFRNQEGTILLPRFKAEYSTSLNGPLAALGMGQAFSDSANFSGISPSPLKISDVLHKTYIETDEEGTEAAAVTGITMSMTALRPVGSPFYMDVNRPFFFAIQDDGTGEILFMGVINSVQG